MPTKTIHRTYPLTPGADWGFMDWSVGGERSPGIWIDGLKLEGVHYDVVAEFRRKF